MLATETMRVALVTIHLHMAEVPGAVTADRLESVLRTVVADLERRFGLTRPVLGVCGLNPHAGEDGHLGTEEIHVSTPVLEHCGQRVSSWWGRCRQIPRLQTANS